MDIQIRNIAPKDFPEILLLNEQAVPQVSHVDLDKLKWFTRTALYFRVAEANGKVAGFLIAVADDCDYQSQYFQWFCERYKKFVYINRIIVAEWARGNRVAWQLYEDIERYVSSLSCSLAADVYSDPPNDISLKFHNRYGFKGLNGNGMFSFENGIKEFPLTVYSFAKINFPLAGGAYFRLIPYSIFKYMLEKINKKGDHNNGRI